MSDTRRPVGISLERLSATFQHDRRGDVTAVRAIDLDIRPGELLTLLGPSGCGKTTTLRMIAGFQEPSSGRIVIGGDDVTVVPANRRDIGFVFQNYALFPHLTVFENVAYGLRVKALPIAEIAGRTEEALRSVGLAGLGDRQIHELSGGQQQRVALARATVIRPRVLLFDEPLSNLDAKLRVQVRNEIASLQRRLSITTVYVTHDQEEAMAISHRIAVMEGGRIAQLGTAEDLYRRPASAFVAGFLGRANILPGEVMAGPDGIMLVTAHGALPLPDDAAPRLGSRAQAVVRPEALSLRPRDEKAALGGIVVGRTYLGDKVEYDVDLGGRVVHVSLSDPPADAGFKIGQAVSVVLPRASIHLVPGDADPGESPPATP